MAAWRPNRRSNHTDALITCFSHCCRCATFSPMGRRYYVSPPRLSLNRQHVVRQHRSFILTYMNCVSKTSLLLRGRRRDEGKRQHKDIGGFNLRWLKISEAQTGTQDEAGAKWPSRKANAGDINWLAYAEKAKAIFDGALKKKLGQCDTKLSFEWANQQHILPPQVVRCCGHLKRTRKCRDKDAETLPKKLNTCTSIFSDVILQK